jgi:hypothetical protein
MRRQPGHDNARRGLIVVVVIDWIHDGSGTFFIAEPTHPWRAA